MTQQLQKGDFGTRQAAPTLDGIRDDHKARYRLAGAVALIREITAVADVGCGVGYGSYLMAHEFGLAVRGYEIDQAALDFADEHYAHTFVKRERCDISRLVLPETVGLIAAFEIIEHFEFAPLFLRANRAPGRWLVGSVPNQELVPFDASKHPGHVRHYTPAEIEASLYEAGWQVLNMGCQIGKRGEDGQVRFDSTNGRTIIFVARA